MTTHEILTGIREASCRGELTDHADLIDKAELEGKNNYSLPEALVIGQAMFEKVAEFDARVLH